MKKSGKRAATSLAPESLTPELCRSAALGVARVGRAARVVIGDSGDDYTCVQRRRTGGESEIVRSRVHELCVGLERMRLEPGPGRQLRKALGALAEIRGQ